MFTKSAMIASALMMTVAPIAASAAPAAPAAVGPAASLSLTNSVRPSHAAKHRSDLFGASAILIIAVVAVAGVGIAAAATDGFSSSN